MNAVLIAFGLIAVLSFLAATAVMHFLSKNGLIWLSACLIVVLALSVAYLFTYDSSGAPQKDDYRRFVLLYTLFAPALFGAILGGLFGAFKWTNRNR